MSSTSRAARVDLTVGRQGLQRGLRDARKDLRSFGRDAAKVASGGGFGRAAARAGGGLLGGVGAVLGGGAAFGLGSIAADVMDLERALTRYQIATDSTPEKMAQFRASLVATSKESGIARSELLKGAAAYVALTGDAAGAAAGMKDFSTVVKATGSSIEDIAETAAAMKNNLKIDPSDFKAAFSALHVQGKAGAVELRDLATLLAGLAPSFAQFKGGAGAEGLAEMGAALQVVKQGFGSASEASTGLRALMVSINRNADKFKKVGVQIYDRDPKTGVKRLRNFSDIIDGIAQSPLAKSPDLLTKAFGSDEAQRAFQQLLQNRALLDDLIKKSRDRDAIDRDAATYQESAAGRMEKAWNNIKLMVAEAFTPERIQEFVAGIETLVEKLGKIVGFIESIGGGPDVIGTAQDKLGFSDTAEAASRLHRQRGGAISLEEARAAAEQAKEDIFKGALTRAERELVLRNAGDANKIPLTIAALADARQKRAAVEKSTAAVATHLNVTLKVGSDTLAKLTANSTEHRTRPGGR